MFFPECEGGESKKSLSIEINFRSAELEGLLELIDGYTIKTIQKKGIIQTELNGEVLLHLNIDECCEYNTMYHEKMFSYLNTEVYGRKFKVEYILPDFALEYEV